MKTFEALLVISIMYFSIVIMVSPHQMPKRTYGELRDLGQDTMLNVARDENFRSLAISASTEWDLNVLRDLISDYLEERFELMLIDENGSSIGSAPSKQEYVTVTYLVDGNISQFKPTKVRLFLWIFEPGG